MMRSAGQVRRIVVTDDGHRSWALSDGVPQDTQIDPARPGYISAKLWATRGAPIIVGTDSAKYEGAWSLVPPDGGSLFRLTTFPPDAEWIGQITETDVSSYFAAIGSPDASTYSPESPHPYMQKTSTLDMCIVVAGEIVLVLDKGEVTLRRGDTAIIRGANHAWANRSDRPCSVAFSIHRAHR